MSLTADERLERQEEDTGDPDEIVVVPSGSTYKADIYHDPECRHVKNRETTEMTRHKAQLRWKGPCGTCIL